jgi:hypothetical protein
MHYPKLKGKYVAHRESHKSKQKEHPEYTQETMVIITERRMTMELGRICEGQRSNCSHGIRVNKSNGAVPWLERQNIDTASTPPPPSPQTTCSPARMVMLLPNTNHGSLYRATSLLSLSSTLTSWPCISHRCRQSYYPQKQRRQHWR